MLAYIGIKSVKDEHGGSPSFGDLIGNAIFRNIVISLAATVGLYLISSLLFVRLLDTALRVYGLLIRLLI